MVRDLQMTPSLIENAIADQGSQGCMAGWEPDILGLSMRWPFRQMMSRLDSQSNERDHINSSREAVRSFGGECVWAGNLTNFGCWWSAGGDDEVVVSSVCCV